MPELVIMGSANAIPTRERDNTYLTLHTDEKHVLIDCGSNAWVRLMNAGMTPDQLTDIIITHFHPDHVAGLPLLLMDLWLQGRKSPLVIHGLRETTSRIKKMMDLFWWENWPGFFEVNFAVIPPEKTTVLGDSSITVWANPVKHLIPTIGLRMDGMDHSFSIAYTCDTEPCQGVDELARGADILIHESAGKAVGHSSPAQAGETAARAEVDQLVLIHYPDNPDENSLIKDAREKYAGKVLLAKDGMVFRW
jgi:ribonuclease Z